MENKIGIEANKLEQLFTQIKQGKEGLDTKIYNSYLPLVNLFSKKFGIKREKVQDLYNDVFSYVYNNVLAGMIKPSEFTVCFENLFAKQCVKIQANNESRDIMLGGRVIKESYRQQEDNERAKEFATQSLLFVIKVLDDLSRDPELAQEYGLNEEKIAIIKDYYGLNIEHQQYKVDKLAQKYNITESRASALLVSGLKKLRKIKDFQPIKEHLK